MKWRWLLVVLLLALALPGVTLAQGELTWTIEVVDARCDRLFGTVTVFVFEDGEPKPGVPITFTWHGFEFTFTTGVFPIPGTEGRISTIWGYTPGEGEVTVEVSHETLGTQIVTFSGPDECPGVPYPDWSVVPSCDGTEITFSAAWEGELDHLAFWLGENQVEFFDPVSPVTHTFPAEPDTTYYYLFWWTYEEGFSFTEGFVTAGECPPPAPELNRYHPWVIHSTLGHEGLDKVGVWGYFEGHWADQFEFFEVTHEGGHVAWVGMPDGDYKAVYRWCENGEVREYWDHFSFGGATDIVGPTINLAEVEYTVVGPCGEPDPDP